MGLVDYSDSEGSDIEEVQSTTTATKSGFQKVVDRSNPGKIRVNIAAPTILSTVNSDEPPTKRVKICGGGHGGLNSFLPPPKRTGVASSTALGSSSSSRGLGAGLGAGVNLKTGMAPGFSRSNEEDDPYTESMNQGTNGMSLPPPKGAVESTPIPAEEVKLVGKPMMFRPLSVSRNPAKKKKAAGTAQPPKNTTLSISSASSSMPVPAPVPRPKVSLFSVAAEPEEAFTTASSGEYKPMIYGTTDESEETGIQDELSQFQHSEQTQTAQISTQPTSPGGQTLDDIALDLGLSAADRRQLFGRQKGGRNGGRQQAASVINFNTDREYEHNEEVRASGETVSHNPVRAIAPGKHSLKQLVNAAATQKDALEESFQKGRNNRAEASSRYGW